MMMILLLHHCLKASGIRANHHGMVDETFVAGR